MSAALPAALLAELSAFVASRIGLHFPQERWEDLANSMTSAAREQGQPDALTHIRLLLSTPPTRKQIQTLASHLTVGETYFFREKQSFRALEERVLPELIRGRRGGDKRLRIWSAGCCTGEEPYSIAMLLDRLIPDIADWNVTILASDINSGFLDTASRGTYREWSFRAIPDGIRERYFSPAPGGRMQIAPRIRGMVTFAVLNLAEDSYPSIVNNTNAMDLVFCRNVLMYFTPENAARAVASLHRALREDGWLLVAPGETSQVLFRSFAMVGFPGAIFYRKPLEPAASSPVAESAPVTTVPTPEARTFLEPPLRGDDPPRNETTTVPTAPKVDSPGLQSQELANQGRLEEANAMCGRAISLDPLNPSCRFLRAMVEQELGMLDDAARSLKQALYLDQDFIMAHFALANLGKRLGRHALSIRHFRSALGLLEGLAPESPLPDSGGLSAGRLAEVLRSAMAEKEEQP